MNNLGMRIKTARSLLNINSSELARRSKLSRSAISRYENNQRFPSYRALTRMADTLGVSVDYLVGDERESLLTQRIVDLGFQEEEEKLNIVDK